MEIPDILRKLKPLIPRQVAQWQTTLDVVDAPTKKLIEQQIVITAHNKFGQNFRERLLLSLPPRRIASGAVELGTVHYVSDMWPFGLSKKELMQNVAIFGRSGAGKTNVVFQLLLQLQKQKVPFLFLDWKKTARHMLPHFSKNTAVCIPGSNFAPLPFNPLIAPPNVDRRTYLLQIVDLVAQAYTLGDGAKSVLFKACINSFERKKQPTFTDVLHEIKTLQTRDRQTGWKLSALRAVESLTFALVETDPASQLAFTKQLLKQKTIIELDGLSSNVRKFLIPLLCLWIYSVRLMSQRRESLQFVMIFEEAHHVLYRQEHRSKETLMNQLLRQGRELGIGSVVVDQHPHLISSAALGNCHTTICLNLKDPTDINKAAGLSLVDESSKRHLSMLKVGRGIVKMQDRFHHPFVVDFPLVQVQKGAVTDSLLREYILGNLTLSKLGERAGIGESHTGVGGERERPFSGVGPHSPLEASIENKAISLLEDVILHPHDGVDVRYVRVGVSRRLGNSYKRELINHGLLSSEKRKVGRTFRVLLLPTEFARKLLSNKSGNDPQASFTHEYWKQAIAERLKQEKYHVILESPRKKSSGCMDIRAMKRSKTIAVEIETGKSDVVSNVKRDLLEGVKEVWVFATDETALTNIEKTLAKAGLILPRRVRVMGTEVAIDSIIADGEDYI